MTTIPPQLPGIPYAPPPAGYGPELPAVPPRLIVIHMTDNTATAAQEAAYAHRRPRDGATSAHFWVDTAEVVGGVTLHMQAWAARYHGNLYSWQIEICGRSKTFPVAAVQRAADLMRQLCRLGGVPMIKLDADVDVRTEPGIVGHADITTAYPEDHGTHTDPGWTTDQWHQFIHWVTGPDARVLVRLGDRGLDVETIQVALNVKDVTRPPLVEDGIFGPKTDAAVRQFQEAENIRIDGIVGPITREHLGL